MARRRSKKLRYRRQRRSHFASHRRQRSSHFGEEDFKPFREGVSFKINDDVKFWNAYSKKDGTVIAYVSNTNVDEIPIKYCIVRLDDKKVNIESSDEFQVWGEFPDNVVQFRQLEDGGDIVVKPKRIYILTSNQVGDLFKMIKNPTLRSNEVLVLQLFTYLNLKKNYVLQIILNENKNN
jgi:hypothetical protein